MPNVEVFQSAWTQFLLTLSALLRAQSTVNANASATDSTSTISADNQEKSLHNLLMKSHENTTRTATTSVDSQILNLTKSQSIWSPARSLENETHQNFSYDRHVLTNGQQTSFNFGKNRREPKEEQKIFPVSIWKLSRRVNVVNLFFEALCKHFSGRKKKEAEKTPHVPTMMTRNFCRHHTFLSAWFVFFRHIQ